MSPTRLSCAASIIVLAVTALVGLASAVAIVVSCFSPAGVILATTLVGYAVTLFISPNPVAQGKRKGKKSRGSG